ncbi:MAG: transglycosylase family protein [Nocardioidaceae bacterium]|nr:transglycosylase family protein [Nocardioidaceae bacterium]MCL2613984.1 transglycosylase family protein [Nocardioidaceae bacterium]
MRLILGTMLMILSVASVAVLAPASSADAATVHQWKRVARCESGDRWHINTHNGYYGGLQISDHTWRAYGGHRWAHHASGASRWRQTRIANRILHHQGRAAWPTCGHRL